MGRRNDADAVSGIKLYHRIFPYLMTKRSDAFVYYSVTIDMTKSLQFIRRRNMHAGEHKYQLFTVIAAALVRTIALKPALNRFVSGHRYWQRRELSFNFVVKQSYSETGAQRNAVVRCEPDMTFEEIAALMRNAVSQARNDDESREERALAAFFRLPHPLRRLLLNVLRGLDTVGRYPKSLGQIDGLHASAFIANLGSIGLPSPLMHHLYNWGTTSLFVSFGRLERSRDGYRESGTMEFGFTIDERIAEGYYFMRSVKLFQYFLENPHMLEQPPDLSEATDPGGEASP